MNPDQPESEKRPKTPLRFWIYALVAVLALVFTSLWLAGLFSGGENTDKSSLKDGRMLRAM